MSIDNKKNYLISDEDGNLYGVKNWEELFNLLDSNEIEDLYVVTKYTHSFEKAMIELEEKAIIQKVKGGTAPIEDIENSLEVMAEYLGEEKTIELDEKVVMLFNQKNDDINPSNFMHLN